MKVNLCKIDYIKEIAKDIFDVVVESEFIANNTTTGQFLHIHCGDNINTLLRRPISICDVYDNKVRFIFQVKGEGTKELATKKAGDILDIIGPLGNGFTVDKEKYQQPMIIGGGIGIFPLLKLAKDYEGSAAVFLGFRDKQHVTLEDEFMKTSSQLVIATDNGSYGENGLVTLPLYDQLERGIGDIIYACGPMPMLKAVKAMSEKFNVKCQLSLEQRMGCGVGACLTCSCETILTGTKKYKRVCMDGPIFWSDEVII